MSRNVLRVDDGDPSIAVVRPSLPNLDNLVVTLLFVVGGTASAILGFAGGALDGRVAAIALVVFGVASWFLPVLMIWQYRLIIGPDTVALGRIGRRPAEFARRSDVVDVVGLWTKSHGFTIQFVDANCAVLCELPSCFTVELLDEIETALNMCEVAAW